MRQSLGSLPVPTGWMGGFWVTVSSTWRAPIFSILGTAPGERPFPHFVPFGSLIQGAALCSSFDIKSGLVATGPERRDRSRQSGKTIV